MMKVFGFTRMPGFISTVYRFKNKGNGLYVFNLKGDLTINGITINSRDGLGIWDTDNVQITAETGSEFLLMEVPMTAK